MLTCTDWGYPVKAEQLETFQAKEGYDNPDVAYMPSTMCFHNGKGVPLFAFERHKSVQLEGIVVMEAGHPRPCTVLDLLLHIHTATMKFSKKSDPPQLLVTRLADSDAAKAWREGADLEAMHLDNISATPAAAPLKLSEQQRQQKQRTKACLRGPGRACYGVGVTGSCNAAAAALAAASGGQQQQRQAGGTSRKKQRCNPTTRSSSSNSSSSLQLAKYEKVPHRQRRSLRAAAAAAAAAGNARQRPARKAAAAAAIAFERQLRPDGSDSVCSSDNHDEDDSVTDDQRSRSHRPSQRSASDHDHNDQLDDHDHHSDHGDHDGDDDDDEQTSPVNGTENKGAESHALQPQPNTSSATAGNGRQQQRQHSAAPTQPDEGMSPAGQLNNKAAMPAAAAGLMPAGQHHGTATADDVDVAADTLPAEMATAAAAAHNAAAQLATAAVGGSGSCRCWRSITSLTHPPLSAAAAAASLAVEDPVADLLQQLSQELSKDGCTHLQIKQQAERFDYVALVLPELVAELQSNVQLEAAAAVLSWLLLLPSASCRELMIDMLRTTEGWLDKLIECWSAEVEMTGCAVKQAAEAAEHFYAAEYTAGCATSRNIVDNSSGRCIKGYLAGICQLMLNVLGELCKACCKDAAAANHRAGQQQVLKQAAEALLAGTRCIILQQLLNHSRKANYWRDCLYLSHKQLKADSSSSSQVGARIAKVLQQQIQSGTNA